MSRGGRYVIDRMKIWARRWNLKMPVPPYDDVNFWEHSYRKIDISDPPFEWGEVSCTDLLHHTYRPMPLTSIPSLASIKLPQQRRETITTLQIPRRRQQHSKGAVVGQRDEQNIVPKPSTDTINVDNRDGGPIETSLGELLGGIYPNASEQQSILILGSGTSPFGEDLLLHHWKGPIIQVDWSSRLVEYLFKRYPQEIASGNMIAIQDDATVLSALNDGTVHSVWDKGLLDALFCTDAYSMMTSTLSSVHRVLRPNGTFCTLSLSHPEFLLPKLLPSLCLAGWNTNSDTSASTTGLPLSSPSRYEMQQQKLVHRLWSHIEIRSIEDYFYCYRFTKKQQQHPYQPTTSSLLVEQPSI
jgi:hypothetical protein